MQRIDASNLAHKHMAQWGLIDKGWQFRFNDKPRQRLGCCFYARRIIEVTGWYVDTNKREVVEDTILHEIAHALASIHNRHYGHGEPWKQWCVALGCMPKSCKVVPQGFRSIWGATCEMCGRKFGRRTKPRNSRACPCTRNTSPRPSLTWVYNVPEPAMAAEMNTSADGTVSTARDGTIRALLIELGNSNDPLERKRIRSKLRRMGHTGGLL